jgi:hypothetical protein
MGTTSSANDEWIELYNSGSEPVDLTGWTLQAADGTPAIDIASKATGPVIIGPGNFFLLERTDDDTVPGIAADAIYTGALGNEPGETLVLKDASSTEVYRIDASAGWPAGDNVTKDTMQLSSNGWVTDTPTPRATNGGGKVVEPESEPAPVSEPEPEEEAPVSPDEEEDPVLEEEEEEDPTFDSPQPLAGSPTIIHDASSEQSNDAESGNLTSSPNTQNNGLTAHITPVPAGPLVQASTRGGAVRSPRAPDPRAEETRSDATSTDDSLLALASAEQNTEAAASPLSSVPMLVWILIVALLAALIGVAYVVWFAKKEEQE